MKHTQQPNKSAKPTNPQPTIPKVTAKQPAPPPASEAPDPDSTKQSQVIALLGSPTGATLIQLRTLTGWQPHTVRGMLSGSLRKRLSLNVQSQMVDGERVYRIVQGSVQ